MKQTEKKAHCERGLIQKIINFLSRCGAVLCFIFFVGIWGGMEHGPLMIGKRLFWSVIVIILAAAAMYGDYITRGDQDGIF